MPRKYFTECFDTLEEYEDRIGRFIMFAGNGCGDYYCYRVLPRYDGLVEEFGGKPTPGGWPSSRTRPWR